MAFDFNNLKLLEGTGSLIGAFMQTLQSGNVASSAFKAAGDQAISAASFNAAAYTSAGQQALEGGKYSAAVYRNAGKIARQQADYNVELDRYQQARADNATNIQLRELFETNRATQGGSGLSFSSGSYLSTKMAALSRATSQANQMQIAAKQRQNMITYQGQLSDMNFENQARGAEYTAAAAKVSYENQAKAAQYQGIVDQINYENRAAQAEYESRQSGISGLLTGAKSLAGYFSTK